VREVGEEEEVYGEGVSGSLHLIAQNFHLLGNIKKHYLLIIINFCFIWRTLLFY